MTSDTANDLNAPSAQGAAENGKKTGTIWTIGRKAAAIIAVAVAVGIGVQTTILYSSAQDRVLQQASAGASSIASLLASQISGALRWKKSDVISASYAKFAGDRSSGFAGFTAFSADGKTVNSFTSKELKSYDLSGSALTAETAKDGIVKITESHIIAIFPVTSGKSNKFIGTVATAWTLEQINADAQAAAIRSLIIAVIVLLSVVGLLTTFIRRVLSKPIINITDSMDHLA